MEWIWPILFWLILSFFYLGLTFYLEPYAKHDPNAIFTVRELIIAILVLPFTLLFLIIYAIMWFLFEVCHLEDAAYAISDFLNKPIRRYKDD